MFPTASSVRRQPEGECTSTTPLSQSAGRELHVLHVTPAFHPATYWGGPIHSVYGLCNAIARSPGVKLRVLTTDTAGPGVLDRLQVAGFPARYPPGYDVFFCRRVAGASIAPGLLLRLGRMVRWADIVHLTASYSFPTLPTLAFCSAFDKPLVWSPSGGLLATRQWKGVTRPAIKRRWEQVCNALVRAPAVVLHATSETERAASVAAIPRASAVVIPIGVDAPERLPSRAWLPDGRMRMLYMGRLSPEKGLDNLFQAIRNVGDASVRVDICGTGPTEYVKALKENLYSLGVQDQVTFRGHVENEQKEQAFREADVCVVPSHTENFAIVVAEALARGVPVIASKGTPWAELEEKDCGLWVANDPVSLAGAFRRVRSMDLSGMGARGRLWMQQQFSWEKVGREMIQLYERLRDGA